MLLRVSILSAIAIIICSCCHRELLTETKGDTASNNVKQIVQFYRGDTLITSFDVEVARTDEERARGLMFRKHLLEDKGMLFVFEDEKEHYFWMKNTYIPLDIIFINSDLKVVGVYENATPMSEDSIYIGRPSKYVLEINGGLSKKFNIDTGTKAVFINIF